MSIPDNLGTEVRLEPPQQTIRRGAQHAKAAKRGHAMTSLIDDTTTDARLAGAGSSSDRYTVGRRTGDWWAARCDRRGLRGVDIERLAETFSYPAAHLRWVRARSAEFVEGDHLLLAEAEARLAPAIERLDEINRSLDDLAEDVKAARATLQDFPPLHDEQLVQRNIVEADDDDSVIRLRRAREYEARRHPVAARVDEVSARYRNAVAERAMLAARIIREFDTLRKVAMARHAFTTMRVEHYLRTLLHRNQNREAAMALVPLPVIAPPAWVALPCPWLGQHPNTHPRGELT